MKNDKKIAVITGDIVDSSALSGNEKYLFRDSISSAQYEGVLLRPKFYRGDSFQLAVKANIALSLALKFRAELKRKTETGDIRICIGIGEFTEWNENVLLANGTAFERSGKNLDKLKKLGLNILVVTGDEELDRELETYCYLADSIIQKLTAVQTNIVYYKLDGTSQNDIAQLLQISQPAVSKTLKAANWKAIKRFLERYNQVIEKNYGTSE